MSNFKIKLNTLKKSGMPLFTILIAFFITCVSCSDSYVSHSKEVIGYDLTKPESVLVLPDTLREVSGLTTIDASTIACVQDENGILFIYDVIDNKIKQEYHFNINGDYEELALVGTTMFVLRSDGTLFEIENYQAKDVKLKSYVTGIPATNNEGLCYDPDHKRLLIACKSKAGKGPELKDKRVIYAFDLETKKLSDSPVFNFDVETIKKFAVENKIELPEKKKKKGTDVVIKFFPSAVAIHPVTKKLFVLSAVDHMLFVFDMNGKLEHLELLDPEMFNKAEGITFLPNNDLLISNEAQNKKPTLLRFSYLHKSKQ